MTARNCKNQQPNFKVLASEFPELRKHCRLMPGGKIAFDFQSDDAVRALTIAILKKDYGLTVNLPAGSLVPRIPSRMNYLYVIEELVTINNIAGPITGIDIGTGASCIYALLGAKQFGWNFIATEFNSRSASCAQENVEANNLGDLIDVVKTDGQSMFSDLSFQSATFSMCNPPFYHEKEILEKFTESEDSMINQTPSASRSGPSSATAAQRNELLTKGGEVEFVGRMIEESTRLGDQIKFFTSLLGKKKSLKVLKRRLGTLDNVNYSVVTLEQGKTHRWVLIWSFSDLKQFTS